ncbi:NLR family CARD domain-containing protein 4 [Holothuria leucospilota]|uniref:NLR family CARD domain-containing protein 4 n=1 Tax=Holothuria leucospilota TaxID=206669 RepID=A0A9Q1CRU0_HOLLE|nr:NLR family CARD domain-containing protein 4 [Holothuria leucospilota]
MIQHLVEGLKSQYKHRNFKVSLLPYRQEKWISVNEVFVAPNIERNHPKAWKKVSLYHEIISLDSERLRTVVHSDPGFGKSVLLQQFAYDWCTSSLDSPLQYVNIFILLRLREFQGMKSIYDAIRTILPAESILTTSDIKDILTKGQVFVTFAFDGFDEYINANVEDSDITKIIKGEMFPSFGVVVTTRSSCLQHLQSTPLTQFRLFGFNNSMQETYIERVLGEKPNERQSILSRMQESDILRELCQVPFFFALYAQISLDNLIKSRYDSVTGYFSHMLACLFSHMHSKIKRDIKSPWEMGEENLQHRISLGKVAYNGLVHKTPQLSWSEEKMLNELGSSCYEFYVNAGILLKEYEQVFVSYPGSHLRDHLTNRSSVSFLHTTVQEYYAAVYIAHMLKDISESDFVQVLKRIDCNNSHYVFRFICGLDPLAAKLVLDFLRDLGDDADMYSILCVLEQGGDGIDDVIAELCKKQIVFFFGESKLLQRSKILVLQLASKRKISIFSVCLFHCLLTSSCNEVKELESLDFYTGLSFPILDTLKMLMIDEIVPLQYISEGILHYATKCRALKSLM